jgi:BirA family transcriptional regulator, biotin operon repressor / biotin---[acetyl-CoA-carboxylase] ligase
VTEIPTASHNAFRLQHLKAEVRPFRLHWFARLRSTNDYAAALRKRAELYAPAIVLAGRQTAGRGRGNNSWWSRPGCITVTFALPVESALAAAELPLVAGLAIRNAAVELTGDQTIGLKWPNDVYRGGRKLAGLLCERVNYADLVGIGINVNLASSEAPAALRKTLTSLSEIAGRPLDCTDALICIASHVRTLLLRRGEKTFGEFLRAYRQHDVLRGKRISVRCSADELPMRGECQGIDSTGRLVLKVRGRQHHIIAGHVMMDG